MVSVRQPFGGLSGTARCERPTFRTARSFSSTTRQPSSSATTSEPRRPRDTRADCRDRATAPPTSSHRPPPSLLFRAGLPGPDRRQRARRPLTRAGLGGLHSVHRTNCVRCRHGAAVAAARFGAHRRRRRRGSSSDVAVRSRSGAPYVDGCGAHLAVRRRTCRRSSDSAQAVRRWAAVRPLRALAPNPV